jgi:hypothetical protein
MAPSGQESDCRVPGRLILTRFQDDEDDDDGPRRA